MFDVIAIADWQTHHLMLFNLGGIRFNLHFVVWFSFLCFFMAWCQNKRERVLALILLSFQFLILFAAWFLDYLDYMNVGSGQYSDYIVNVGQDQERSYGVRPDALVFAFVDYLTLLVLTKLVCRPRRIIDPISFVLLALIMLHFVVATFNFDEAGALMAYDMIWTVLYYAVFVLLFLTSSRGEKWVGHISVFDYCHLLFGSYRSKTIHE